MYRIKQLVPILLFLGCTQAIGCGQTEYTGALKERYQACQFSQGFEYHPEEGQCYCDNGIVCDNGYVCDTAFNACIKHEHLGNYDCEDPTLKYAYDSASGEMVMRGECNACNSDVEDCEGITPVTFDCDPNIDECDFDSESTVGDDNSQASPPADPGMCNPDGGGDGNCNGLSEGKVQTKHFACETTLSCKDNTTITLVLNGKTKEYHCPYGCKDGVCLSAKASDECKGSMIACITNNDQSKQYQCQGNKWVALPSNNCLECDISKEHCVNDNVEIRGEMIQYYKEVFINNESLFIPIKNVCNDSDGNTCNNCQIGEQKCINEHIKSICNEYGIWERKECCILGCTDNDNGSVECKTECEENNQKCDDNQIFNCVNGIWTESTSCPNGCNTDGKTCA